MHAAPMRLDDGPGLEQTNAEAFLLGALKGTEQGLLHVRLGHAATVIRDRQNDAFSLMFGVHLNPASRAKGISRVEHEVCDDALDLFAVSENAWERLQFP